MNLGQLTGLTTGAVEMTVTRARLRLFARAVGENDPVYVDVEAARAAGHPDLLVPPTFLFGVEMEAPEPFAYLTDHGVDLRTILHGEQEFEYLAPVHAGSTVRARSTVVDVHEKKGGALTFLVRETLIRRDADLVARLRATVVVRRTAGAGAAA